MKNSLQTMAVLMAVVVLALPAIAQQPESETTAVAKQASTGCPACKAAQTAECATCPASCEVSKKGDQQCPTCNAVKPIRGIPACDKCNTFVAVTSDEQARKIRETCAENCPYCEQRENTDVECAASVRCSIGDCTSPSCQDCPGCPSTNAFASTGRLPGSVSFVNENASELAQQRLQLADELVAYLSTQKHKPEHIRQVLRMALESTADDAHRAAMTMQSSDSFDVGATATCQTGCTDQTMAQLSEMVFEMRNEMDMMSEGLRFLARHMQEQNSPPQQNANLQNRNQQSASQSSPMPVQYYRKGPEWITAPPQSQPQNEEMKQRNTNAQNRNVEWTSQSNPLPTVYYVDQDLGLNRSTAQMQQRIRELEQQLQRAQQAPVNAMPTKNSMEQRLSASWNPQGQLQPTSWQSEPLRPKESIEMQLNPAPIRVSTMVARQYYVGDLMSPPFASATLRLMQQIKTTVAPDSWEQASIQIVSPSVSLLVTQTPENHEKIARMLNTMRGGNSFR